jgi:Ran GTPase-activating protein (RanGAP) involved in mRNA processing and transport
MAGVSKVLLNKLKDNSLGAFAYSHVDISSSVIGPGELKQIVQTIEKNIKSKSDLEYPMVELSLANNRICGVNSWGAGLLDFEGVEAFERVAINRAKNFMKLKKLNLANNHLSTEGMQHIGRLVTGLSNLMELDLHTCSIGPDALVDFSGYLNKNATLTSLNLSENNLHEGNIQHLAKALVRNKALKLLNLSECSISDEDLLVLCPCLESNKGLETLYLKGNPFDDLGANTIGTLLARNTPLQHLDLQYTGITDSGVAALAECLESNSHLATLGLQWCNISNRGALIFAQHLPQNKTLVNLLIMGNSHLDAEGHEILENARPGGPEIVLDLRH